MTLTNGWTAGSITPQYMKDSRGRVFTRGRVVSPAGLVGTSACWSVPVGFRSVDSGNFYFNWADGASPAGTEAAPKRLGGVLGSTNTLVVNYNASFAAELGAGLVWDISSFSWPTT